MNFMQMRKNYKFLHKNFIEVEFSLIVTHKKYHTQESVDFLKNESLTHHMETIYS